MSNRLKPYPCFCCALSPHVAAVAAADLLLSRQERMSPSAPLACTATDRRWPGHLAERHAEQLQRLAQQHVLDRRCQRPRRAGLQLTNNKCDSVNKRDTSSGGLSSSIWTCSTSTVGP